MPSDHSSGAPGFDVRWSDGEEHWTTRLNGEVDRFLWHKPAAADVPFAGTILFGHGSSMASQPTFDLSVVGRPDSSAMDWFRARGFDTWCSDNEGYGRSSKHRPVNFDIGNGADDLAAVSEYILKRARSPKLMVYGISSGALKAALFAQQHPRRVERLALDAFVWTGEGSRTLAKRRERMAEWTGSHRRPIDQAFVHSIFNRDHPGTAEDRAVEAHRERRRPAAVLPAAAERRQAVRGDGGHRARKLPAEELPQGLPHPACISRRAGAGLSLAARPAPASSLAKQRGRP
jgi:pimeloyl-ACP methyl ester carboxylesterase